MAVNKNTYGLPDETLQLIGAGPELNFGSAPQGGVPMSNLINALRGERSSNNPGVRLLANRANDAGITFNRNPAAASNRFPILTMPKGSRTEATLPSGGGGGGGGVVGGDGGGVFIIDDFTDDEIIDDDVIDEEVVDDDIVDDEVVDDDTDDTVDDDFEMDLDTDLNVDLDVPEDKEKTGIVEMEVVDGLEAQDDGTTDGILDLINAGLGDGSEKTGTVDIEVVDSNVDTGSDDGTTDGIQDVIDSMGGGSGGSGSGDDYSDSYDFGNDFGSDFDYDFGDSFGFGDYSSGGGWGGGGGGGGCPAPWVGILLADGSTVKAGDIKPGMEVFTRHEKTEDWGVYPVTAMEMGEDERWEVILEDGRTFVGTFNHRVCTDADWIEIRNLKPGDKLVQQEGFGVVKSSKYLDNGPIVKITVAEAHTYISEGFLSHNIKIMSDYANFAAAYAKGGKVTPDRLAGPNPAGPDDGFAALKNGEFVLNKDAAKAIGYELLDRLNRSRP